MTAAHFFAADVSGSGVKLEGEEARHAVRVLRIRPGEEITVSNGAGEVVRATVTEAGAVVKADVKERRSEPQPRPALHVFAAIPKAGKLDLVVQKLTELGVEVIQPFPASRSVARWDSKKAAAQTERLNAISREAAKQSRRAWLAEVRPPQGLDALELPEAAFVLDEEAIVRLTAALPDEPPETIGLIVGPEGGFEREEIAALSARGASPASLGPLILRTETAALVAATVASIRYERLG
jgi:16S rRNA (uracil1498-N3)-methyltransferase